MTSIKLKFRPSTTPEKAGALVFQLIHERKVHRIKSNYKIFDSEWDAESGQIICRCQAHPVTGSWALSGSMWNGKCSG